MSKLFCLLMVSPLALSGQDVSRWNLNVGVGPSFPTGNTTNRINTGFNFTAGGGFNFSDHIGLNIDYIFNDFNLTDQALAGANAPGGYSHV
jgi:opacity protein-like surface antigen